MHGAGWVLTHERRHYARCTVTFFHRSSPFLSPGGISASSKKGGCAGISAFGSVSVPYPYHGVSWCRLPIILATIQRPILRFLYDIVIRGQGSRGGGGGGVSTFLCIMRSVGYDLGRCPHQSDDDILFKPRSYMPCHNVLQPDGRLTGRTLSRHQEQGPCRTMHLHFHVIPTKLIGADHGHVTCNSHLQRLRAETSAFKRIGIHT
jgi:hypothetical protein